jgi:hypothetical protein
MVSSDGGIADMPDGEECPWDATTGDVAVSAVLDFLLENPARSRSLGVDAELLELLWC